MVDNLTKQQYQGPSSRRVRSEFSLRQKSKLFRLLPSLTNPGTAPALSDGVTIPFHIPWTRSPPPSPLERGWLPCFPILKKVYIQCIPTTLLFFVRVLQKPYRMHFETFGFLLPIPRETSLRSPRFPTSESSRNCTLKRLLIPRFARSESA